MGCKATKMALSKPCIPSRGLGSRLPASIYYPPETLILVAPTWVIRRCIFPLPEHLANSKQVTIFTYALGLLQKNVRQVGILRNQARQGKT